MKVSIPAGKCASTGVESSDLFVVCDDTTTNFILNPRGFDIVGPDMMN